MKITRFRKEAAYFIMAALFLFGVSGCLPETDTLGPTGKDRYLPPPWLGGTSIEILEDTTGYSTFIALMDKAEYREAIEKQLFTLFVPNDEAFNAYFQEMGIAGVDELTTDQAENLFALHVLPNARSAYQLKYEYYWGELQGPTGEYASLFFRKQTNSSTNNYKELVRYNEQYKGEELIMYGADKLVSLFSKDFFEDFFGATDGSDYTFLFPESQWGDNLNWHNAMVTDPEVKTASGFIYFVDQVVGPMPSIEEYFIENEDRFGLYYDIAQRFAEYTRQPSSQSEDNIVRYKKTYRTIEDFAEERGPNTASPNFFKDIWSIYVPTDAALQEYLDNTVYKYYESLDSVPEVTLYYIVQTHISRSLGLRSKIKNSFFNYFGDPIPMTDADFESGYMCSNGPFYGINKVLEPSVFSCVPGRLFFDDDYTTFLFALEAVGLTSSLADPEADVTLFAVTNEEMLKAGIRYESEDAIIQVRDIEGQWIEANEIDLIEFLNDHIYAGSLENIDGEGYIEMVSKNYVYYNNGQVMAGGNINDNDPANTLEKEINEKNGVLYTMDNSIRARYEFGQYLLNDPDCQEFANLLIQADLLDPNNIDQVTRDTVPNLRFIAENNYWTGLIPSNAAVTAAINDGIIPTDQTELKDFLSYHFIRKDVIFDNGEKSGTFDSNSIEEVTATAINYYKIDVNNIAQNLSVTDNSGQVVQVDHANANNLVRKGVIHKIDAVLLK